MGSKVRAYVSNAACINRYLSGPQRPALGLFVSRDLAGSSQTASILFRNATKLYGHHNPLKAKVIISKQS